MRFDDRPAVRSVRVVCNVTTSSSSYDDDDNDGPAEYVTVDGSSSGSDIPTCQPGCAGDDDCAEGDVCPVGGGDCAAETPCLMDAFRGGRVVNGTHFACDDGCAMHSGDRDVAVKCSNETDGRWVTADDGAAIPR